jgi:hypothetical protein
VTKERHPNSDTDFVFLFFFKAFQVFLDKRKEIFGKVSLFALHTHSFLVEITDFWTMQTKARPFIRSVCGKTTKGVTSHQTPAAPLLAPKQFSGLSGLAKQDKKLLSQIDSASPKPWMKAVNNSVKVNSSFFKNDSFLAPLSIP